MVRQGFRNVTVRETTHEKLVACSNEVNKSIPDTVEQLATQFLDQKKSRQDLRKLQEDSVRGS